MRFCDSNKDWKLRIGEVQIQDEVNGITYSLVVGYVNCVNCITLGVDPSKIYFRLYGSNDEQIVGTWFNNSCSDRHIAAIMEDIPFAVKERIAEQIKRLEALRIFA
jgi:hypothetical protein